MGEGFEKVKVIVKSVAKKSIKPFAIIATIVVAIVIIAAPYIIKKEDASHKENDWKNTPYAAEQYSSDITISPEGEITTTMTAQELWDKMLENDSRVNEYLDKPEELLKLMNAENVTKFLDTRQNPDEPIDWESLNKAITENKIQGIIKLKRADSSGNTSTMTYIAPEELQKLIDEYNKSGSEEAKQEALKHFTIQKGASTSSSLTGGAGGVISSSNGITVNKIREVTSLRNNPQIGDYIIIPPNTEENKAKNGGHDRDRYLYENKSETDGLAQSSYDRREQINQMASSNQYGMKVVSTYPNVYMVATSQKFGDNGDVVAFELSNGSIILTCQGDDKGTGGDGAGQARTDEWGHYYGASVVEFFEGEGFSNSKFIEMLKNEFGISNDEHSGVNVVSATYLGNVLDGTYLESNVSSDTSTEITTRTTTASTSTSTAQSSGTQSTDIKTSVSDEIVKTTETTPAQEAGQTQVGTKQFTTYPDLTEAQLKAIATVCQAEQGSPKGAAAEASLMANHLEQRLGKNDKGQYPVSGQGLYDYAKEGGWFASDSTNHMDEFYIKRDNHPIEYLKDDVVEAVRSVLIDGKRTLPGYIDEHDCFPDFLKVGGRDTGLSPWKGKGKEKFNQRVKHCPSWVKDRSIYIQHETLIENAYDGSYTFYCFPTETSDPFGYTESAAKLKSQIGDYCYDYDTGIGSGSSGSGGLSNTSMSSYYAVVATWSESSNGLTSNDPDISGYESTTTYSMTTQTIDYQNAVKAYQMPFDYLWALTVIGGNKDFTLELADLVENSELEITVHDNLTVTTMVDTQNYTKKTRVVTKDIEIVVNLENEYVIRSRGPYGPYEGEGTEQHDYATVSTTVTKTDTLDIAVTKANVWIVDYEQEFTYQEPEIEENTSEIDLSEEEAEEPDRTDENDPLDIAEKFRKQQEEKFEDSGSYDDYSIDAEIVNLESEYYDSVEGTETIYTKTETSKYVSSPATTTEKTDKKSDEPNFVSILSKNEYTNTKNNILSAAKWLFEILEENKNTADMVDLTKYLLYKTSGTVYDGIKEFDFESKLKPGDLQTVTGMGIYGGTIQEKVWFALKDLGYKDEVVAGAMGNIDLESGGFSSSAVEKGGTGIGLIQWSFGRADQLRSYAASKGVEWTDEDTQIEFLITEITGQGAALGYAERRTIGKIIDEGVTATYKDWENATTIEDATLAFMRYFESPKSKKTYDQKGTWGDSRLDRAKKYYEQFHGKERSTAGFVGSSSIPSQIANGTKEQKLNYLFPNGIPSKESEMYKYMTTIQVDITKKSGQKTKGSLTVHKAVAQDVQNIFKEAQDAGFVIYEAGGYDFRRMNNSSGASLSHHSYGIAIDINVNENYSRSGSKVYAGSFWNPAKSIYSIPKDGVLVKAFAARGWKWGGNWSGNYQDYMHFSLTGN